MLLKHYWRAFSNHIRILHTSRNREHLLITHVMILWIRRMLPPFLTNRRCNEQTNLIAEIFMCKILIVFMCKLIKRILAAALVTAAASVIMLCCLSEQKKNIINSLFHFMYSGLPYIHFCCYTAIFVSIVAIIVHKTLLHFIMCFICHMALGVLGTFLFLSKCVCLCVSFFLLFCQLG